MPCYSINTLSVYSETSALCFSCLLLSGLNKICNTCVDQDKRVHKIMDRGYSWDGLLLAVMTPSRLRSRSEATLAFALHLGDIMHCCLDVTSHLERTTWSFRPCHCTVEQWRSHALCKNEIHMHMQNKFLLNSATAISHNCFIFAQSINTIIATHQNLVMSTNSQV